MERRAKSLEYVPEHCGVEIQSTFQKEVDYPKIFVLEVSVAASVSWVFFLLPLHSFSTGSQSDKDRESIQGVVVPSSVKHCPPVLLWL